MAEKKYKELGVYGLKKQYGVIEEEFLTDLQGAKAIKVYKEMVNNDSTVGTIMLVIKLLMRKVRWDVEVPENATDENQALEDSLFLLECWEDMSHTSQDFISEACSMIPYGWAWFEEVYKLRMGRWEPEPHRRSNFTDGKIGWRKFALRPQDTLHEWKFNPEDGGVIAMVQEDPDSYEKYEIPLEKSLLFRTETYKNNPEGKSLLRHAYRPWFFKKNIENIEAIGTERDLCGIPVMKAPASIIHTDSADADLYNELKKIIRQLKNDENAGMILPSDTDEQGRPLYDFNLVASAGTRQFDTDKIIMRKAREIAMSVIADFILLGHENVGSYALSENKTTLFADSLTIHLDTIAAVLNKYAIPRLFQLNNMEREVYPKLYHLGLEATDLDVIGRFLTALSQAGMPLFPDYKLENHLRKLGKMPLLEEADDSRNPKQEDDDFEEPEE